MDSISEIVSRLADNAEAVCRRYLPRGRREGSYWLVGDIRGAPGRSLYVLLSGAGEARGRAGKWTDAASGEHGDLLDIIAASCGHGAMRDTLAEARRFLSLPSLPELGAPAPRRRKSPQSTAAAAKRLWLAARPIVGTVASAYLAARGIDRVGELASLRFHPACYYRPSDGDAPDTRRAWPAMIAAVTDGAGELTGVHRTWLDPGVGKAPVAFPRRAMGHLLGHGVRFGIAGPVMAAGEGIETLLSLREVLPDLPMIAGLSAAHLAAIDFPVPLRRLYVACDADAAGVAAYRALAERGAAANIEVLPLEPAREDFNDDLAALGALALAARVGRQLDLRDAHRLRR